MRPLVGEIMSLNVSLYTIISSSNISIDRGTHLCSSKTRKNTSECEDCTLINASLNTTPN